MNNQRRKAISEAVALMEKALELLEPARDDEQESFGNLTEGLQQTERGQQSEQAADNLDTACSSLQEAIDSANAAAE